MDPSLELALGEILRKLDELDARSARRWAVLERRGATIKPDIGGPEPSSASQLVKGDNWGGFFDEIPAVVPEERGLDPTATITTSSDCAPDVTTTGSTLATVSSDAASPPPVTERLFLVAAATDEIEPEAYPLQILEREKEAMGEDELAIQSTGSESCKAVISVIDHISLVQGAPSTPLPPWRAPLSRARFSRTRRAPPLRRPRRLPPRPPRPRRQRRAPLRPPRLRPWRIPPRPPWLRLIPRSRSRPPFSASRSYRSSSSTFLRPRAVRLRRRQRRAAHAREGGVRACAQVPQRAEDRAKHHHVGQQCRRLDSSDLRLVSVHGACSTALQNLASQPPSAALTAAGVLSVMAVARDIKDLGSRQWPVGFLLTISKLVASDRYNTVVNRLERACEVGLNAGKLCFFTNLLGGMLDRIHLNLCTRRGIVVTGVGESFSVDIADPAIKLLVSKLRLVVAADLCFRARLGPVQGNTPEASDPPLGTLRLLQLMVPEEDVRLLQLVVPEDDTKLLCTLHNRCLMNGLILIQLCFSLPSCCRWDTVLHRQHMPCPPPTELRLVSFDAGLRPPPWPSFNMVEWNSATCHFGRLWRPPWFAAVTIASQPSSTSVNAQVEFAEIQQRYITSLSSASWLGVVLSSSSKVDDHMVLNGLSAQNIVLLEPFLAIEMSRHACSHLWQRLEAMLLCWNVEHTGCSWELSVHRVISYLARCLFNLVKWILFLERVSLLQKVHHYFALTNNLNVDLFRSSQCDSISLLFLVHNSSVNAPLLIVGTSSWRTQNSLMHERILACGLSKSRIVWDPGAQHMSFLDSHSVAAFKICHSPALQMGWQLQNANCSNHNLWCTCLSPIRHHQHGVWLSACGIQEYQLQSLLVEISAVIYDDMKTWFELNLTSMAVFVKLLTPTSSLRTKSTATTILHQPWPPPVILHAHIKNKVVVCSFTPESRQQKWADGSTCTGHVLHPDQECQQFLWDPGGSILLHRLGGKPKLKKGGMSGSAHGWAFIWAMGLGLVEQPLPVGVPCIVYKSTGAAAMGGQPIINQHIILVVLLSFF